MGEKTDSQRRDGDSEVSRLEAAYRSYAAHVYTLCLRLLAGVRAAEDVTVQVFVRLSRELAGLRDETRTLARLRELAVEEALALLRVGSWNGEPSRIIPLAHSEGGKTSPPDPAALDALAARLPDALRVAFVLHDQEGLSDRAIAAHLHIDEPEARRLVHRARTDLRRLWFGQA